MLHCVETLGYPATTVADVVARAEVSRSTFYAQFEDKEDCFVAAYDLAMSHALQLLEQGASDGSYASWRERVRSDLTAYLRVLGAEPALARTLHVEVLAAGPRAQEHRAELLGVLAARIANLGELARGDTAGESEGRAPTRELPPAVFALFTGGLDELIRDRLRTGSVAGLEDLADPLVEATYAIFAG